MRDFHGIVNVCGFVPIRMDGAPDTGGNCCLGAAEFGPERCTCWEPVFDVGQAPIDESLPIPWTPTMCPDCAYRPGSPERAGTGSAAFDQEDLDDLVTSGEPFSCHQGIRRPTHWVHPSGATMPADPLNYQPVLGRSSVLPSVMPVREWPFKADGTPANLCAGWVDRRARHLAQQMAGRDADAT